MRPRLRLVTTCLIALGLAFAFAAGSSPQQPDLTESATRPPFNAGNIIDDDLFFNGGAMSTDEVQGFLDLKGAACQPGADGTPCLKNYRLDTADQPADQYCRAYDGRAGETAAAIITKVGEACGISQRVLLVMLQKEQSLVTNTGSTLYERRYREAMGYACPDYQTCDPLYRGFFKQVYAAAKRFVGYRVDASKYNHRVGVTSYINYYPVGPKPENFNYQSRDCGKATVYIQNQATAALYNYTPYVPTQGALAAGYGEATNDPCATYGNRNFFFLFVDWFGSTQTAGTSINDKYAQLKAAGVDLAAPTSEATCDLPGGGCYRSYQGGTIFWSRDTGPHVVRGAILEKYLSLGGPQLLGYPTGDDTAATVNPGWYTDFQHGAIYWSQATGAREVRGDLLATWRAKGAQAGVLGYPVGGDEAVPGGYRSRFQGGTLYWSPSTKARMIRGPLLAKYEAAGGPRALGFPTADDGAAANGGTKVGLQRAAVYWSKTTGAHVVRGSILTRWQKAGAEAGRLGYPTADETALAGGAVSTFTGGSVYWSPSTGSKVVRAAVLRRYVAHGGPRVLGFPTTEEIAAAGGGTRLTVQGGAIYWSEATGAHVVRGEILARWRQLGGEAGRLGYPVGDDAAVAGGYQTAFRNGTVYWSRATGAKVVRAAILRQYVAAGGPEALGFPTADEGSIAGGARVELQRGAVYWSEATGAHVVRGEILARWRQLGGESGRLGFPIGDDTAVAGGNQTAFRNGTIYWSKATGAKVVRAAIQRKYVAAGGPAALGFPTADEVSITGGAKVELQGGAVYWSSGTGAHVVRGEILARWRQLGAESGRLGYPTGDDAAVAGGVQTAFRNGTIYWSRATGAKVVRAAIQRKYVAAGGPAALGFPTADEVSITGGAKVELQRGAVYWSSRTGAHAVESPAAGTYAGMGGPGSYLGFPTGDTRAVPGGRQTDFQGGSLVVTADGQVSARRS